MTPLYDGGTMEGPMCAECGHLLNTEGKCFLGHVQAAKPIDIPWPVHRATDPWVNDRGQHSAGFFDDCPCDLCFVLDKSGAWVKTSFADQVGEPG